MAVVGYPQCTDAVIVVPGIMGSELVETATARVLWGLRDPAWYVRAWTSGTSLETLRLTEPERAGKYGRIAATRLLRFPAFAPFLRGFEPYTSLVAGLRRIAAAPEAVLEFPYDWRLPVAANAALLAVSAERHLAAWRSHPRGSAQARLAIVAHSLGGLVARHFTSVLGGDAEVRLTVTIGTPFFGSVKALSILNARCGGPLPLPHRRLGSLAATLPAVYELLPAYRCVDEGASARRLTGGDVASLGGDAEFADAVLAHARAGAADRAGVERAGALRLCAVVGVEQPTGQSVTIDAGVVCEHRYSCVSDPGGGILRVDRGGDSTVCRDAASLPGSAPVYLPQTHGGMPQSGEVVSHVRALLTEQPLGPPLGGDRVGLDSPDVSTVGRPCVFEVTGVDDPAAAACRVAEVGTDLPVSRPLLSRRDGQIVGTAVFDRPGVYRIVVKGGGYSAVEQFVMAVPPDVN